MDQPESWSIPLNDLTLEKEIGRGAYGRVYRALYLQHTVVAAKQISKTKEKKSTQDEFQQEVGMLRRLRHPNIVLFMGVSESDTDYYIVQEFVKGGGMNNLIRNQSIVWPWKTRVRMALEIAQALMYLHTKGVLHRDVKSENVLLDKNSDDATVEQQRCKMADFGLSLLFSKAAASSSSSTSTTKLDNAGTAPWKAPEVNLKEYDERADIFSFGMILAEISARVYGSRVRELINNKGKPDATTGYLGLDSSKLTSVFPVERHHYPPLLMDLAVRCCREKPEERPTLESAITLLEKLRAALVSSEREAEEALSGDEHGGAAVWIAAAAESVVALDSPPCASRAYLVTVIADRCWETTQRNLSDAEQAFLASLLPSPQVSLKDFCAFWTFYIACERVVLSKHMAPLWKADFIHGFISKDDTMKALEHAPAGTFICRFSNSAPGKLAISYQSQGKVSHLMVTVNPDAGFTIGSTSYANFLAILNQSKVFTTVAPDKPLSEFTVALQEAANLDPKQENNYNSVLE